MEKSLVVLLHRIGCLTKFQKWFGVKIPRQMGFEPSVLDAYIVRHRIPFYIKKISLCVSSKHSFVSWNSAPYSLAVKTASHTFEAASLGVERRWG